jgi:signal transduction histidine kinase
LQRLLNEILQYTRCQTLQAEPLELNTLIQEMLPSIRAMPAAQARRIEFTPVQPVYILGDRDKLKQIFINLISNACEAIAAGEVVSWNINTCPHQRTVCISIYNQGEPISADSLARLTKPFFTTKSNGNGLGLAIVKQIVEAHKGELVIDSSAAIGGTQVTIILPFIQNQ